MAEMEALFAGPWGPLIIFVCRILDVSLATVRTLLLMRGERLAVPFIAVAETLIWVFAVGNAIKNLASPWHLFGYAGGFATGNLVGMWLEEKLAFGLSMVTLVSRSDERAKKAASSLREAGFGVTQLAGKGKDGPVHLLMTAARRKQIPAYTKVASAADPEAVLMVEETRALTRGWLAPRGKS